ncbi:shikimate kinase [Psychroflexus tropicus]|uniref:shikimate kinase n=1 Tax=Psychroflexus tropicus TaxID=197345 RepID=UPI000365181A|nr:shikimate kinase [Psychroflexus tropicus]
MKVILLGYMGVGKSTLGRLLAENLNTKFIDLDDYIESREHLSIPEIFNTKGEIYFRKKESKALEYLLGTNENFVLALGGGTPVYGSNMEAIVKAEQVTSIYLKLQLDQLVDRLFNERKDRPIISHYESKLEFEEFVRKHLFERQQFYFLADHNLDLTETSPEAGLQKLLELLGKSDN